MASLLTWNSNSITHSVSDMFLACLDTESLLCLSNVGYESMVFQVISFSCVLILLRNNPHAVLFTNPVCTTRWV